MSVAKVIEISVASPSGFASAQQSERNIREASVKEPKVTVANAKITRSRVDLKATFIVD
jgi:hypothetical protein